MRHDGAVPQRTRSPFHASLKPTYDVASDHFIGDCIEQRQTLKPLILHSGAFQSGFNLCLRELRPEVGVVHLLATRLLEDGMVGVQGGANRQAFITGRRLNPRASERGLRKQFPIRHAVERATARHGKILVGDVSMQFIEEMEKHFLEAMLHGIGKIHIALRDLGVRLTRRAKDWRYSKGT